MTYFQESGRRFDELSSELVAQRGKHISKFASLELDAEVAPLAVDL